MKPNILKSVIALIALVSICALSGVLLTGCKGAEYDYTVGINQYLQHPALDMTRTGFQERLEELMTEAGKTIEFDYANANADSATATTINNNLMAKRVDLIYAIATPSAQSAKTAAEPTLTPVVYGAVSDPATAGLTGLSHVTGASDSLEMDPQIELIEELLGGAINGKIAYIHTSSEDNSRVQGELLTTAASSKGIEVVTYAINAIGDLQSVFTNITTDSTIKAIYIAQDNLLAANMQQVANLNELSSRSLPVICADTSMASAGGIAAFGMNYTSVGRAAAELAYEILVNGKTPGDIPVHYQTAETLELLINKTIADKLGITIPQELLARAETII